MTVKNKKPSARKRSSSSASKKKAPGRSGLWRSVIAAVVAAAGTFQIASCSLDPNWHPKLPEPPFLSTLPIPGLEHLRKQPDAGSGTASGGRPPAGSLATGFSHCRDFFPGGEPPALQVQPQQRELCFSAFAVLHSGQTKTPVFVVERLNRQLLAQGQGLQRSDKFYADARLPSAERAELDDYRRSGYSRGHMAPAGDMYSGPDPQRRRLEPGGAGHAPLRPARQGRCLRLHRPGVRRAAAHHRAGQGPCAQPHLQAGL
jgi:endonuclease G